MQVEAVFARYSHDESGDLTYEDFLLLLSECSTESALFNGLLGFAEGAVSAGIQLRFSASVSRDMVRSRPGTLSLSLTLALTRALTLTLALTLGLSFTLTPTLTLTLTRAARVVTFWTTVRPRGASRSRPLSSSATTPPPER